MVKDLKASKKQSVKSGVEEKPSKKAEKLNEKSKPIKKDKSASSKLSRRFNKLKVKPEHLKSRGIIYIGHLPKGFTEDELKKFFS